MIDLDDLNRAAQDLRNRMKVCPNVHRSSVEVIPDDMQIKLVAYMKDGR